MQNTTHKDRTPARPVFWRYNDVPRDGRVNTPVTCDVFLQEQAAWCRRAAEKALFDPRVREMLLDLAREYDERSAAIDLPN